MQGSGKLCESEPEGASEHEKAGLEHWWWVRSGSEHAAAGMWLPQEARKPQGKKQVDMFGSWSEFLNLMFDAPVGSPGSCVQGVVGSVCCWTHASVCWLYMRFWEGLLLLFLN